MQSAVQWKMTKNPVIFLMFLMLTLGGYGARINADENKGTNLAVEQSWENGNFFRNGVSLEDESGEFFVLRERRDTSIPESGEIESGCGEDECSSNPNTCGDTSNCTSINGTLKCICKPGYSANGTTCDDINECLGQDGATCHVGANCTNTVGSYSCACKKGFYGDGYLCKEILRKYSTETVYARQGDSAILVCTFNDTIFWTKAGNRIQDSVSRKIYANVLVVETNGVEEPFGEYECHVTRYNVSITMSLIKYKEPDKESNTNDTVYLVALIIISVLFLVALMFIVYLICKRNTRKPEESERDRDKRNDYEIPTINAISVTPSADRVVVVPDAYSYLGDVQDHEHAYEGLRIMDDDVNNDETVEGVYESVDFDLKCKV